MKYLGIGPRKYVRDFKVENYKSLMKGIKEDLNKWRDIL